MSEQTAKIVLRNRTLRWSTAGTLNDPFEMQLQVSLDKIDIVEVKKASLEKIWKLYSSSNPIPIGNVLGAALELVRLRAPGLKRDYIFKEFGPGIDEGFEVIREKMPKNREEVMAGLSSIKILSLTTTPNIGLMWSHYANSHKGVVMRFRSIPALDSPFGIAKPINYTDTRPSLLTEDYLINSFAGLESINAREINNAVIYTKMKEWEYEKEWRISSGDGRDKKASFEDLPFGSNELDGVIFGLRTSSEDRIEICKLAEAYPNVELMRANEAVGKIGIELI
jgi:hypothetical protein